MRARPSREDVFIEQFLSAYENGTWVHAILTKPDAIDRTNPAVDQLATRKSDGRTVAIEHTIIEPFVGDKEDFAFFEAALLTIETDQSLLVPGRWIRVFVPVGTLQGQPKTVRENIARSVHEWIRANRLILLDGWSEHQCAIAGARIGSPFEVTLTVRAIRLERGPAAERGILHVRRQQVENNLGDVIESALKRKLPKLVNTKADKRILVLERQHMNLYPKMMMAEIVKRQDAFPDLARVDEIWILETPFYGTAFGGTYFRFERYDEGELIQSFDFNTET